MKYSFLMCVNQDTGYLDETIHSVLNQSASNFDFHIIANACHDNLWERLNSINDKRIILTRTRIPQLAFNLNIGLNTTEADYIIRIDADDTCLPDRLQETSQALEIQNYPDVLIATAQIIDHQGNHIGMISAPESAKSIADKLWYKNPIVHPAATIKTKSIIRAGGYLGGFMSEDYDLWLRLTRDSKNTFGILHSPVIKYRINPHQTKGHVMGYAESSAHLWREGILGHGFRYYLGAISMLLRAKFLGHR